MSDLGEVKQLLERIALALESIAESLSAERSQKTWRRASTSEQAVEGSHPAPQEIETFLNQRGIRIKHVKVEEEADEVLDRIALFMGRKYQHIRDLYTLLKRALNTGEEIRLDMKNRRQEEIASITQLCTELYRIAFLRKYMYRKSPERLLLARVNRIPKAINFLTGGWLERYVKISVIETIESLPHPVSYSYVKNPQVTLPNGDDFELDILFRIDGVYFWFEAKTGEYQDYVEKYARIARVMGLNREQTYMILSEITKAGAEAVSDLFGMRVVCVEEFPEVFGEVVKQLLHGASREG